MHRIRILPQAGPRAGEVGRAGALFPGGTINGREASAHDAAGTAQYDIDDIAYPCTSTSRPVTLWITKAPPRRAEYSTGVAQQPLHQT